MPIRPGRKGSVIPLQKDPKAAFSVITQTGAQGYTLPQVKVQVHPRLSALFDLYFGVHIVGQVLSGSQGRTTVGGGCKVKIVQAKGLAKVTDQTLSAPSGKHCYSIGQLCGLQG